MDHLNTHTKKAFQKSKAFDPTMESVLGRLRSRTEQMLAISQIQESLNNIQRFPLFAVESNFRNILQRIIRNISHEIVYDAGH